MIIHDNTAWFDNSCQQPFPAGIQLVAIEREADGEQLAGRIRIDDAGQVWLAAQDYLDWTGLARLPATSITLDGSAWYRLEAIPYQLDSCNSRLQLAASLERRHYRGIQTPDAPRLPTSLGGYVNADVFGVVSDGMGTTLTGQAELGLSAAGGLWRTRQVFLREGSQRLDSQVRWDFPEQMAALEAGDIINTGIGISPNVRFGGLSWGSDFSQRPEQPTYPLPSLLGDATLPSTAELYIDGQLRQRDRLAAGPFALDPVAGLNGAGDLQVIVRDSLGRETVISQPFYTSPRLLRRGLSDYHLDVGRLREGFGTQDDRYGDSFLSGRWHRGLSSQSTLGLRTDLLAGSQSSQAEWLYGSQRWGLWQLGLGASHDKHAGWGERATAGYEWLSRQGSVQAQFSTSSPAFIELGREPGAIARSIRVQTGWRLGPSSSFTLGRSEEQRRDRENLVVSAASWQQTLGTHSQLIFSVIHSPGSAVTSSIGLSQQLTPQWQLGGLLTYRSDDGGGLQLGLTWQPQDSSWSARLASEARRREHATQANWLYAGDRGQANIGIGERNGMTSLQGSLATSLAWIPDNVFWSKRQQNGFVVVDAGSPDVSVFRNHQLAGRTDQQGQLLVSDTWPHQSTEFSLGWEDLPLAAQAGAVEATVRPPRGIGILTLASEDKSASSAWQARLSSSEWLPAGSSLLHDGQAAELPSGLDGLLYLPTVWAGSSIEAVMPDQRRCLIATLPATTDQELTCQLLP